MVALRNACYYQVISIELSFYVSTEMYHFTSRQLVTQYNHNVSRPNIKTRNNVMASRLKIILPI